MNGISLNAVLVMILTTALVCAAGAAYYWRLRKKKILKQAPGSKIALAVSEDFAPSDRFTGFVHEQSGASIVLVELPLAAFDQLKKIGHAEETFAAQGVTHVAQLRLPHRSGDYIYVRGEQNTALVDYAKYILIFCEDGITAMVTANIPRAALTSGIVTGAEIEKILASARVHAHAPEAPKLFNLTYFGPFEEDLSLLGTTKGYRLKPDGSLNGGLQPVFLVAPSLTLAPIPNLSVFAERTFDQIEQIRDKTLEATEELEISGLPAVETIGRGTDASTGAPALVYQLMIEAPHGGYFRLVGLAPESSRETFLPQFRKMAEGFRPAA